MVYEKSALGYTEFTNNKRTLNVRERQVLLLVNGSRDLDDLEKFFKKEHLMEMLENLKAGGYIQATQAYSNTPPSTTRASANPITRPLDHAASPTLTARPAADFSMASLTTMSFFQTANVNSTVNAATMEAVKTILIEATDDYLGLMGRVIRSRISACDNEMELRNCISSWHMAMRESKLGRESTSFLLQQIHHALENNLQNNSAHPDSAASMATALPAENVIHINAREIDHLENASKATDAAPALANLQSAAEIAWSANSSASQPRITPAQKVNAPEPLGFLQNAFG